MAPRQLTAVERPQISGEPWPRGFLGNWGEHLIVQDYVEQ